MTDEAPGDQRPDAVATKAARKTQALLREARSLLGRVEEVATAVGAIDDPTSHQLAAEPSGNGNPTGMTRQLVRVQNVRLSSAKSQQQNRGLSACADVSSRSTAERSVRHSAYASMEEDAT